MITIRTNLPEFKAKLNQISADMQKRSMRSATRAAATVISKIAKQEAPIRQTRKVVKGQIIQPGTLKAAIGVVSKRAPRGTSLMMVIPRSGRKARKVKGAKLDAYYWAWVEQGHVIGRVRGGKRTKALQRERAKAAGHRTRPNPYLRRAFNRGQGQAVDAFYKQLDKAFIRYSAR